jgi:hypothetical protein
LVWSNWSASATNPSAPSSPRAAVPLSTTASIELLSGVFSMVSADIAGNNAANPVTVNGYDSDGNLSVSEVITFTTSYVTYDLSAFALISEVEFVFSGIVAGVDNFVFL